MLFCGLAAWFEAAVRQRVWMPLFMDIHELHGADAKTVAEAHAADVALQAKYDVDYVKYWFNQGKGKIFCLCHAPSAEAAERVHRESHPRA